MRVCFHTGIQVTNLLLLPCNSTGSISQRILLPLLVVVSLAVGQAI